MKPHEFKSARQSLGLTAAQLADVLGTDTRTVRRWEAEGGSAARPPNPMAARALSWLLDGYRPPQWPARTGAVSNEGDA